MPKIACKHMTMPFDFSPESLWTNMFYRSRAKLFWWDLGKVWKLKHSLIFLLRLLFTCHLALVFSALSGILFFKFLEGIENIVNPNDDLEPIWIRKQLLVSPLGDMKSCHEGQKWYARCVFLIEIAAVWFRSDKNHWKFDQYLILIFVHLLQRYQNFLKNVRKKNCFNCNLMNGANSSQKYSMIAK